MKMPYTNIDNELGIIRTDPYGENVRWAIHDAIEKINNELPEDEEEEEEPENG